jgi:hypothetical protein
MRSIEVEREVIPLRLEEVNEEPTQKFLTAMFVVFSFRKVHGVGSVEDDPML